MKILSKIQAGEIINQYILEGRSAQSEVLRQLDRLGVGDTLDLPEGEWDLKTPMSTAINGRFSKKGIKFNITKYRKLLDPNDKGVFIQRVV